MDTTPRGLRPHIAIFGRRNVGKSSLINALTNQDIALVSPMAGTTTDPVFKAMELLPLGPVEMIDTAGIDDVGMLGELRIKKTMEVLNKTDLAIIVIDPSVGVGDYELDLRERTASRNIPVIWAVNKLDLEPVPAEQLAAWSRQLHSPVIAVSAVTGSGLDQLKQRIVELAPTALEEPSLVSDLLEPGDLAVLVVPIDLAAPKGRLILPQVQTLRDLLDHDMMGLVVKERELRWALESLKKPPRIVITDSQAFLKVAADTPDEVMMTSFSILMARFKGDLTELVRGAAQVTRLKPGDRVLIAEACTHHRQADDIGKTQIPRWLRQYVGGDLQFEWSSGTRYPADLESFDLVVHCGACMITRREMLHRIAVARQAGVPIVNYGVLLAFMHGVLERALRPFPLAAMAWQEAREAAS
ncbi:MAG: [FeFe] hydrogenase H-cluster maturation GTPase HydF [Syntrophomonadaceae bacterium]|nr:[FeFe] hydrogenase H-cluster maturation GTPase HydF [Syntrophomonadaceae bacterium]